jgi:hypothetical protein
MTSEQQYLEKKGIKDEPLPRLSQDQSLLGEIMLSKLLSDYNRSTKQEIEIITRAIVFMAKSLKSMIHETPHRKVKRKLQGILEMADKIYKNENGTI